MLCPPESPFLPPPPASAPSERLFCRCPPRKPPLFAPHSPAQSRLPGVFSAPRCGFSPGFPRQNRPTPRLFRPGFPAKHSVCAPASAVLPRSSRRLAAPVWFLPRLPAFRSPPVAFRPSTFRPGRRPRCSRKTPARIHGFFRPRRGTPKGAPNPWEQSRKDRRPLSREIPRN